VQFLVPNYNYARAERRPHGKTAVTRSLYACPVTLYAISRQRLVRQCWL